MEFMYSSPLTVFTACRGIPLCNKPIYKYELKHNKKKIFFFKQYTKNLDANNKTSILHISKTIKRKGDVR